MYLLHCYLKPTSERPNFGAKHRSFYNSVLSQGLDGLFSISLQRHLGALLRGLPTNQTGVVFREAKSP